MAIDISVDAVFRIEQVSAEMHVLALYGSEYFFEKSVVNTAKQLVHCFIMVNKETITVV